MTQIKKSRGTRSVLSGKDAIQGVPPKKKTLLGAATKKLGAHCDSVLEGPDCIQGVGKDATKQKQEKQLEEREALKEAVESLDALPTAPPDAGAHGR